jgi:hypothetical protein
MECLYACLSIVYSVLFVCQLLERLREALIMGIELSKWFYDAYGCVLSCGTVFTFFCFLILNFLCLNILAFDGLHLNSHQ